MTINSALSSLDTYVWEPLQRRWPVLYRVDDREWKTWVLHGVLTVVFGHLIGLVPHVGPVRGMWIVVGLYLVRELSVRVSVVLQNVGFFQRVLHVTVDHYKWRDGFWDVVFPVVFTVAESLWRHR